MFWLEKNLFLKFSTISAPRAALESWSILYEIQRGNFRKLQKTLKLRFLQKSSTFQQPNIFLPLSYSKHQQNLTLSLSTVSLIFNSDYLYDIYLRPVSEWQSIISCLGWKCWVSAPNDNLNDDAPKSLGTSYPFWHIYGAPFNFHFSIICSKQIWFFSWPKTYITYPPSIAACIQQSHSHFLI